MDHPVPPDEQPPERPGALQRWGVTLLLLLIIAVVVPLMDYLVQLVLR